MIPASAPFVTSDSSLTFSSMTPRCVADSRWWTLQQVSTANPKIALGRSDRRGPDLDLLARHQAGRLLAAVAVLQMFDVVQVLLAGQQRPVADVALQVGPAHLQAADQFLHDPRRHVLPLVRV